MARSATNATSATARPRAEISPRARLLRWLASVPFDDPLERELATLFQRMLLLFLVIAAFVIPALFVPGQLPARQLRAIIGLATFVTLTLLAFLLVRRGRMNAAVAVVAAAILVPVTSTFLAHGLAAPPTSYVHLIVPLVLIAIFGSRRGLLAIAVAIATIVLGAAALERSMPTLTGMAPPRSDRFWLVVTLFPPVIIGLTLLLDGYARTFRRALRVAVSRAAELARVNEELRAEVRERLATEEALRASEERYQLAARATLDVIYEWHLDDDVTHFGEGLITSFGYAPNLFEHSLDWWERQVHPDDRARVAASLQAAVNGTGSSWIEEYRFRRADGSYADILDRGAIERRPDGTARRMVGAMSDVTRQRQLELQLRQAHKMDAVGRLAGGVAHDFNNILTAIRGYSDLLLAELPPGSPLRDDAAEIRASAERGAALTRQLLAFGRKAVLRPRPLDMNAVIRSAERMMRHLLPEDVTMEVVLAPDLWTVSADPSQLEQVAMNLVMNARDAMPEGGSLRIETRNVRVGEAGDGPDALPPGDYAALVVHDTGIGMTEETLARIFEPFFTTKGESHGTGLGLPTVHGIVTQSQGHLRVRSTPGAGSTFVAYLPGVPEPAEAATSASPRPRGGSECVLLVEDEQPVRDALRRALERCGYRVLVAVNGREAMETWRTHGRSIDLVLTDVRMPEMGGPALARQLRAERPSLPLVFMSGYPREVTEGAAPDEHSLLAAPLLEKPFTTDEMLRVVRATLDRAVVGERGAV